MTVTVPAFDVGERVIVEGIPHHPYPEIREGGPGMVISERSAKGFVWVRLETGVWFAYLPFEIRREPPV